MHRLLTRSTGATASPVLRPCVLTALLLLAAPASAPGQGSAADYARAAALRHEVRGKVRNETIREIWLSDDLLLYRAESTGGWEFRLADAASGEQRPAFDHQRLAVELGRLLGRRLEPQRLPFDRIVRDKSGLLVLFEEDLRVFRLSEDGTVAEAPLEEALPLHLQPTRGRRSREEGGSADLLFVNSSQQPIDVIWLDPEGAERRYATLQPGERHRQGTYAGHLWLIRAGDEELGRYRAGRGAGLIRIDGGSTPAVERPREDEPPRARQEHISPDGRYEAHFDADNLVVRERGSGEEVLRTTDGSSDDCYTPPLLWSPDSTKLIAMQRVPAQTRTVHLIEGSPRDQVQPKLHTHDYLKPGDRIEKPRPRLFDVSARAQIHIDEALFSSPWSIGDIAWSPDGSAFTFLYNERGHQTLRLIAVDAATGDAHAIIDERSDTFINYSNKTFLHRAHDAGEIIWMSERDGWNHLYLIDSATGAVKRQITRGEWLVRSVERIDEDARQIWFRALGVYPGQDPYHVHFGRVDFDGSNLTWLTEGDGTHELRYSPGGAYYVDTYSRVDLPPVHELRSAGDGSLICELARGDAGELLARGWLPPERFVAEGRDGETDIWGVIFHPTNFDPSRSYPIVENIYAGPHGHFVPKSFSAWHASREIAELGFIVVQIDGMGTNWRNKAFHDLCWRNLGDSGFPDRIAWLKAAAKERPYMDLSRVGIYGGSAGGQSALRALIAHSDFYRAAVADCGCHDNRMDKIWWNEAWMGYPVGPHYEAQSNVTQAHRLQGKLLLIVGELDRNVDPASTMQVVSALIDADKDFDLLVMPGVGHGAAETPYGKRRRADFLVRHLHGREPRWSHSSPE